MPPKGIYYTREIETAYWDDEINKPNIIEFYDKNDDGIVKAYSNIGKVSVSRLFTDYNNSVMGKHRLVSAFSYKLS